MKICKLLSLGLLLVSGHTMAGLPAFYSNLSIEQIETWPNATDPVGGYTVIVKPAMQNTGCANSDRFSVESGDFQDDSLSVLLAAMMGSKKITVRVSRCTDRPIVDRVAILNS